MPVHATARSIFPVYLQPILRVCPAELLPLCGRQGFHRRTCRRTGDGRYKWRFCPLLHGLDCQSPDIQPFHKGDGLIHLFLGDIVGPQAQVQETAKLFLQGEFLGAGYGHIAAHNAGVADIQLIEILIA